MPAAEHRRRMPNRRPLRCQQQQQQQRACMQCSGRATPFADRLCFCLGCLAPPSVRRGRRSGWLQALTCPPTSRRRAPGLPGAFSHARAFVCIAQRRCQAFNDTNPHADLEDLSAHVHSAINGFSNPCQPEHCSCVQAYPRHAHSPNTNWSATDSHALLTSSLRRS